VGNQMIMKTFAIWSLLFVCSNVSAQLKIIDGNILQGQCAQWQRLDSGTKLTDEEFVKATYCIAYIRGVVDTIVIDKLYKIKRFGDGGELEQPCFPTNATNEQVVRVVVKYLGDTPGKLHLPANTLIANAMIGAFPCH
jgi:hypothetical protein